MLKTILKHRLYNHLTRNYNQLRNMIIGTHDGKFHCDEVLACSMLRLLPQYSDATIKRSRDPSLLNTCDIVVDVGGVFDPATHRYDHHQRSFTESVSTLKPILGESKKTRLSSAGLVYVYFGQEVIGHLLNKSPEDEIVQQVYKKVYDNFIEEIDAIDNGISTHEGPSNYKITTHLSSRVGHFNPAWNEEEKVDIDARFAQAMELTRTEFLDRVNYFAKSWWPARELVEKAISSRFEVDPSGKIIELEAGGCPWKEHLFTLEEEMGLNTADLQLLYVIFPDTSGAWRIQGVPLDSHSFLLRRALPEPWRGHRDAELDTLAEVEGCIFIHASGFIGGHRTREGALTLAKKAITFLN